VLRTSRFVWPDPAEHRPTRGIAAMADLNYAPSGRANRFRLVAGVLAEFAGDRRWGAHPPCVDHQFRRVLLVYLRKPEHHQWPAVVPMACQDFRPVLVERHRDDSHLLPLVEYPPKCPSRR
jgi:hypothetical protein